MSGTPTYTFPASAVTPGATEYLSLAAADVTQTSSDTTFTLTQSGESFSLSWTDGGNDIDTPIKCEARAWKVVGRSWGVNDWLAAPLIRDITGAAANDDLILWVGLSNGPDPNAADFKCMNAWIKLGPNSQTVGKAEVAATNNVTAGAWGATLTTETTVTGLRLDPAFNPNASKLRHQANLGLADGSWLTAGAQTPQNSSAITSMGLGKPVYIWIGAGQHSTTGNVTGGPVTFRAAQVLSPAGTDQSVSWVLLKSSSFASVDTASATFALDGVTYTKVLGTGGAVASDANGWQSVPGSGAGGESGYTAPLASYSATWLVETLMFAVEIDPVSLVAGTFATTILGIGDSDKTPSGTCEAANNSTSPSGDSMQSGRAGDSAAKITPAVDLTGVTHLVGVVANGHTFTPYYSTDAVFDPDNLTAMADAYSIDDLAPGATNLVDSLLLLANRGTVAHPGAEFQNLLVYRRGVA